MSASGKRASALAVVVVITGTTLGAIAVNGSSATPVGVGQVTTIEVRPTPKVSASASAPARSSASERKSVLQTEIQKSSVSPSGRATKSVRTNSPARTTPTPKPAKSTVRSAAKRTETVTTIRSYRDCTGFAQSCIDKGYLTKYNPGRPTLAGHNYMGYQWMSRLPVGRTVKITTGSLRGTYKVYDHAWSKRARQGGKFPSVAYGADVVLQTCEPNGTGFSLLRRV